VKALVTGATGFLGSHLVARLLADGWEVRALARTPSAVLDGLDIETARGDIRDLDLIESAFRGIDVVFHTAAVSGIWGPWKLFHSVNVIGTRNVVECCLRHRVPRLVYTSSPSVTFNGKHQIHENESAPYADRWLCHYPHTKALAEQHVLDSNDPPNLMTCALRPHLIWGPGDRHLIPRIIQRGRLRQLRRIGDGTNQIDTTYIDNAVLAHVLAANGLTPGSPVCGRAYFISQGDPVNCWGFINEVLALAGIPKVRKQISFYWAWRLGAILETWHEMLNRESEPRMTRFLAAQLARSHYFDISRARNDFGYEPDVSHEQGMKRLAASLTASPAKEPAMSGGSTAP
jgi:nucleoside-diphosphate-sugar epimerase